MFARVTRHLKTSLAIYIGLYIRVRDGQGCVNIYNARLQPERQVYTGRGKSATKPLTV